FGVLGPLEVRCEGVPVSIEGREQRVLLALSLLLAGEVVGEARLIRALWPEPAPADARGCCGVRVQRAEVEAARLRLRAGRCRSRPRPVPRAARRGAAAARAQAGRGGGVLRASVGALARAAVLRAAVGAARQGGGRAARAASPGGA